MRFQNHHFNMRDVSIIGIGQIPVLKKNPESLRIIGARAVRLAMESAGIDRPDALYLGNMLADELQGQKHTAALIADTAGLHGTEALEIRAVMATGAATLRMAYLAVASGHVDLAIAVGVEKMSEGDATAALSKALDVEREVPLGASMISVNAMIMRLYMEKYKVSHESFTRFSENAHRNAFKNPNAMFQKEIPFNKMVNAKIINPPIRLFDCAPVCDGAAAVVLAPSTEAGKYSDKAVMILGSAAAIDRFCVSDRENPATLEASRISARKAFDQANISCDDIDFFEVHDAFTIMSCLELEACGFAEPGQGWRLAEEGAILPDGRLPLTTMGGLKARGHPIGATAFYQVCEIVLQLTGRAGENQLPKGEVAMMQSVGGAGSTILTHIFGV